MWITNIAIVLDAEIERGRAIAAGHDPVDETVLELRDARKIKRQRTRFGYELSN
jgi:membrane protein